jgi:hypothetical protein
MKEKEKYIKIITQSLNLLESFNFFNFFAFVASLSIFYIVISILTKRLLTLHNTVENKEKNEHAASSLFSMMIREKECLLCNNGKRRVSTRRKYKQHKKLHKESSLNLT